MKKQKCMGWSNRGDTLRWVQGFDRKRQLLPLLPYPITKPCDMCVVIIMPRVHPLVC